MMKVKLEDWEREHIKSCLSEREVLPGKDVFVDAVFFPWDDPTIGMTVVNDTGIIGKVVGCVGVYKDHGCSCYQKHEEPCAGWWLIESDKLGKHEYFVWYPPSLKPVK